MSSSELVPVSNTLLLELYVYLQGCTTYPVLLSDQKRCKKMVDQLYQIIDFGPPLPHSYFPPTKGRSK